jgi:hypothetical protein
VGVIHSIHCKHHIIFYEVTLYSNENISGVTHKYSGVSFCDGSFYSDSLLRPLSKNNRCGCDPLYTMNTTSYFTKLHCIPTKIYRALHINTERSRFATVRFTVIHFYNPCPVEPSTPDLWCITVATQASFLYLVRL